MSNLLKQSIVRIRKENGDIVGVGFLIGESQVITCAHVVKEALNIKLKQSDPPQGHVHLDFPFLITKKILTAEVTRWNPTRKDGGYDIAGLELSGFPPTDARSTPFCPEDVDSLEAINYKVFGFPGGHDEGVWSAGKVIDERGDGLMQLEGIKVTGKRIEAGFSGGPVWDKESRNVIGMITTADKQAGSKVAFMIPMKKIFEVWPELRQNLDKPEFVEIPIVIVAMTKKEAESIFNDSNHNGELSKFHDFKKSFINHDVSKWLSHYSENRENWQPHACSEGTICDVIWDIVDEINYLLRQDPNQKFIRPKFVSKEFFDEEDEDKQDNIWSDIREFGGIIIVDAVSVFHPNIQKIASRSEVFSHRKVSVLVINPLNTLAVEANRLIEEETRSCMRQFFTRFAKRFEESCELGVSSIQSIERWLYNILPKTAEFADEYQSDPNTLLKFRRQSGDPPRHGYSNYIAGRRTRK
jgi:V8-like Glu-specific endopeptidase